MQVDGWTLHRQSRGIGWRSYASAAKEPEQMTRLLSSLAARLGTAVPGRLGRLIEAIIPQDSESAPTRSLSAQYGLDGLPFHMDSAHRLEPARLLMIGCVNPGKSRAQTLLIDTKDLSLTSGERQTLFSAPFLVRTGRRSFYSTILDKERPFMRYDPGCMEPVDSRGATAMSIMKRALAGAGVRSHTWSAGEVLMINNWRMLHGRSASAADNRLLFRISVQ